MPADPPRRRVRLVVNIHADTPAHAGAALEEAAQDLVLFYDELAAGRLDSVDLARGGVCSGATIRVEVDRSITAESYQQALADWRRSRHGSTGEDDG